MFINIYPHAHLCRSWRRLIQQNMSLHLDKPREKMFVSAEQVSVGVGGKCR